MRSKVWLYPGMVGWHFISVPKNQAEEIKKKFGKNARGWGSLPVVATLGKTKWKTSIFPDKRSGTYLLPLNIKVRNAEGVAHDDTVMFTIEL